MKWLIDFCTNYLVVCAFVAWITAQVLKVFTGIFRLKTFSIVELLFGTGGMPSSHTAAVFALTAACGIKYGFGSAAFAISGVLALIVMRDAMGMRRQVGEHAKTLNLIMKEIAEDKEETNPAGKVLSELAGHTPLQVAMGALTGVVVALGLMFVPLFGLI